MDYKGKVVVITGAAKGIGRGLAREFAKRGAKLALADLNLDRLNQLVDELKTSGTEVFGYHLDVSDYEQIGKFCAAVYNTYDKVDYLINNAGVTSVGNIIKLPLSSWERIFSVNTMSTVYAIKTFLPRMIAQDEECYFITTGSNSATNYLGATPAYSASKAAVSSIINSLAVTMLRAGTKVKVKLHSPGAVATEISYPDNFNINQVDEYFKEPEFIKTNTIIADIIAHGMSVEDYTEEFFRQLEDGRYYIRPTVSEEPTVKAYCDGIINFNGPYPLAGSESNANIFELGCVKKS